MTSIISCVFQCVDNMHWCFKPSLQILLAIREKLLTGDVAYKIDSNFSQFTLKEIIVASLNFSDKMLSTFRLL